MERQQKSKNERISVEQRQTTFLLFHSYFPPKPCCERCTRAHISILRYNASICGENIQLECERD